jgi:hypothetical protein
MRTGIVRLGDRVRRMLVEPLPEGRMGLYFGLGSLVLAIAALYYAGRIFELQRRDAMLFELENRYQEYEQALLTLECFNQHGPIPAGDEEKQLRAVADVLRALLLRKDNPPLRELLDVRDEVLTTGSGLLVRVKRRTTDLRRSLLSQDTPNVLATCDP